MMKVKQSHEEKWLTAALKPGGFASDLNNRDLTTLKILGSLVPMGGEHLKVLFNRAQELNWRRNFTIQTNGEWYHHFNRE